MFNMQEYLVKGRKSILQKEKRSLYAAVKGIIIEMQ